MMNPKRSHILLLSICSLHLVPEIRTIPTWGSSSVRSSLNHGSTDRFPESQIPRSTNENVSESPQDTDGIPDHTGLTKGFSNEESTFDSLQNEADQVLDSEVFDVGTTLTSISRTKRAVIGGPPNALFDFPIKAIITRIKDGLADLIDVPTLQPLDDGLMEEVTPNIEVKGPFTWITKYLLTQANAWYALRRYDCTWYEIGATNNCAWFWAYKSIQLPIKWALQVSFLPVTIPETIAYYTFLLPVLIPQWSLQFTLWGVRLVVVNLRSWQWLSKVLGKGVVIAAKVTSDLIDRMWRNVMNQP